MEVLKLFSNPWVGVFACITLILHGYVFIQFRFFLNSLNKDKDRLEAEKSELHQLNVQ